MKMDGEQHIPVPRARVWAALNDPQMLKAAIPGCESVEKRSDTEFQATVIAKVGPVKAKFRGGILLENLSPPESYDLVAEVKGGPAGFAKTRSHVELEEDGEGTMLRYAVDASIGGKLAQVGQRLVDGAAKKMADDFFSNFVQLLNDESQPVSAT